LRKRSLVLIEKYKEATFFDILQKNDDKRCFEMSQKLYKADIHFTETLNEDKTKT